MISSLRVFGVLAFAVAGITACTQQEPAKNAQGVNFTDVHFADQFWLPRMEINRTVSIPSAFYQCQINGRFDNFALAGGLVKGIEHQGDYSFDDTDVYKILEGASYSLAVKYDPKLDAYLDSVIVLIAAAQEDDGYLTTCVTNNCTRLSNWWGSSHWERINSHELYNSGHLYEAAVAHYQATGKRTLLDVAIKNANLVCEVFGPNEGQKHVPSGHPIIEMALVKLYHVTGEQKYIDMARYFIDEAGRGTDGHRLSEYSQDHKPIVEQDEAVGHAVRLGYFYSGITDVASLQQDKALQDATRRVWENVVSKKLYITGGIGARGQGEGFGPNYELSNMTGYCETCASIANVYWNHRLFLMDGDSKYIDVLERTLYNGVISGVSLSGNKFFYDNPLESNGVHDREEWFGCACCPGNVTRFMASIPGYAYAVNNQGVYVNLFVEGTAEIPYKEQQIKLSQQTRYPWDGDISITIEEPSTEAFKLYVRIPGWTAGQPVPSDLYSMVNKPDEQVSLSYNGKKLAVKPENGYAVINKKWKKGDVIKLHLPMTVNKIKTHDAVTSNHGKLALQRGPIVYCLEDKDNQNGWMFDVIANKDAVWEPRFEPELLGGVVSLSAQGEILKKEERQSTTLKAIPYYAWNNRGKANMLVWMPEDVAAAIIKPEPTIASRAKTNASTDNVPGLNDQFEPKNSGDLDKLYFYFWGRRNQAWVEYTFEKPTKISSSEVYWLVFEHYDRSYQLPESWKLQYKNAGGKWVDVKNTSPYGLAPDCYNKVTFEPVTTTALRLETVLQSDFSGGIHEWKVNE